MAVTPTDIANMATALLTEAPIDSLDEDSKIARLLNVHFDTTREAELLKREWVFAIFSQDIAAEETGRRHYTHSYTLPADCLRPLGLMLYDDPDGIEIDWRREGDTLLTRCGGTRTLRYIANLIDPGDWDALFTEVLSAALAIKVAHALTGKAGMVEIAQAAYDRAVSQAGRVNSVQKRGQTAYATWDQLRGGWYGDRNARGRHGAGDWR